MLYEQRSTEPCYVQTVSMTRLLPTSCCAKMLLFALLQLRRRVHVAVDRNGVILESHVQLVTLAITESRDKKARPLSVLKS